ncbi:MAG: three-Cys-motif partner protein TcmP [Vicinamibacterales bacterium]
MPAELTARDGLAARPSGEWAREKLFIVARYIDIFTTGQKRKWPQCAFVDLMAGPGICIERETGEEFPGSPLLALRTKTPFTHAVFVELDARLRAALAQRTSAPDLRPVPTILEGDCNSSCVVDEIRRTVPANALTLAFVDMLGLDVHFATLRRLTAGRRMDLLITFQVNDLTRNVRRAIAAGGDERMDAFFGSDEWLARVREVPRGEYANILTDYYAERLRTLDYPYCDRHRAPMKNSKNAPLYRLLLASRHERAGDYFQKIATIDWSGQRAFPF